MDGKLIATQSSGRDASATYIITSDNGETWTEVSGLFGTKGFAFGSNTYLIAGQGGQAAHSADMTSWTTVPNSTTGFNIGGQGMNYINAAAYGNGIFVIGDGQGQTSVFSPGDKTWTHCDMTGSTSPSTIFNGGFINSIAFFDGKFIAMGGEDGSDKAISAYSTDGLNWTQGDDPGLANGSNPSPLMASGGGYIVAVGTDGKASYSQNGINWTPIANTGFNEANGISDIAYGNGRFVIVGGSGKVAYCDIQ
jgi:hypothetical protein